MCLLLEDVVVLRQGDKLLLGLLVLKRIAHGDLIEEGLSLLGLLGSHGLRRHESLDPLVLAEDEVGLDRHELEVFPLQLDIW